jgi:hypothetical protein
VISNSTSLSSSSSSSSSALLLLLLLLSNKLRFNLGVLPSRLSVLFGQDQFRGELSLPPYRVATPSVLQLRASFRVCLRQHLSCFLLLSRLTGISHHQLCCTSWRIAPTGPDQVVMVRLKSGPPTAHTKEQSDLSSPLRRILRVSHIKLGQVECRHIKLGQVDWMVLRVGFQQVLVVGIAQFF